MSEIGNTSFCDNRANRVPCYEPVYTLVEKPCVFSNKGSLVAVDWLEAQEFYAKLSSLLLFAQIEEYTEIFRDLKTCNTHEVKNWVARRDRYR